VSILFTHIGLPPSPQQTVRPPCPLPKVASHPRQGEIPKPPRLLRRVLDLGPTQPVPHRGVSIRSGLGQENSARLRRMAVLLEWHAMTNV
jgi:hypothetical protein